MKKKVVLSIAGSDSSGGAGVQADLKTFSSLGLHGVSAITCITIQNTKQVKNIHKLPVEIVESQIDVLYDDMAPVVVKTGMLYDEDIVRCVAKKIREYKMKTVVDPVMVATSGDSLSDGGVVEIFKTEMIPKAFFITPNLQEACELTGMEIGNVDDVKQACKKIYDMGVKNILIKGGHFNSDLAHDVFFVIFNCRFTCSR